MPRTDGSLTARANSFQLFHLIGGVLARPFSLIGLNSPNGLCASSGGSLYSVSFYTRYSTVGPWGPRPPGTAAGGLAGEMLNWPPLSSPLYGVLRPLASHLSKVN
jgi:hypothetical protein